MPMLLATQDDVRAALRRDLTDDEVEWLDGLLAEASDLVIGYLDPWQIPNPVPPPIARVVAGMVATVLTRPQTILPDTQSLSADAYSVSFAAGANSRSPILTDVFKLRLRPYKLLSGIGFVSMELCSERSNGVSETSYR
jgi:hypothetical protein